MNKRLTEAQRLAYEKRLRELKLAALEPGKVSGIVDKISEGQADIKGVIESLMRLMDADSEAARYHTASSKLSAILKKAFDMANEVGENPLEEAKDLQSPILHPIEDLEHEIQTMDDQKLMAEVEQLERDVKQDLHGAHDQAAAPAAGQFPAAHAPAPAPAAAAPAAPVAKSPAPAAPAPAPAAHGGFEKAEKTEEKPEPKAEESEDKSEDKSDEKLSPEHKLALLMSLPAVARAKKVANLRALANALESAEKEVSNDNQISTEKSEEALANDYKDQENGSMKDVNKSAALKSQVKQLLAALEDDAAEKDEEKEEKMDKEAVLKLALKHLYASIEDLEGEDKEDDKSEKPPFFEKSEDEKGDEEDKQGAEPSMEEKKAILRARLASLRRTASVDGKTMKTPKEVPSPSGTTEDNLKGDAPVQYSTNRADTSLDEIQTTRQKIKDDKSVAGTDEPNEIYFSSSPTKDRYEPTSEKDSSKEVSNKRVLKDMGTAVQPSEPHAPDEMEQGAGSHQKTIDWEKAKSDADQTPSGDRLKGLANLNEIIKVRTDRAVRLASHMADLGLIKTEKQLGEKIASLASMDDDAFKTVEAFLADSVSNSTRTRVAAAEEADEDEDEEEDNHREAGLVRRASQRTASYVEEDDEDAPAVRRVEASRGRRVERGGLKTPLLSGTEDVISHRASTILGRGNGEIVDKLSAIAWTDPKVEARKKAAELDDVFHGER